MIRHLCRLAWNRRRAYVLLGLEMVLSLLVLFALGSQVVDHITARHASFGFVYGDVWWVRLEPQARGYRRDASSDVVVLREAERTLAGLVVLYLLVAAAALYPGLLAARVAPATALHHE
ncbi:MAG: hypothetical protein AB1505_29285 [Candidatus Latescibacterota bacterium]